MRLIRGRFVFARAGAGYFLAYPRERASKAQTRRSASVAGGAENREEEARRSKERRHAIEKPQGKFKGRPPHFAGALLLLALLQTTAFLLQAGEQAKRRPVDPNTVCAWKGAKGEEQAKKRTK